jgi:4a-hydroxytetrahydrobiopterin dehydratase
MTDAMKQNEVHEALKDIDNWHEDESYAMIQREFQFENFADAMGFVNEVAEIAEAENHHPDICISYNTVVCMLTTHDAGGLTKKDFTVAKKIDELIEQNNEKEE